MAIDPRKMRPSILTRMLNSSPLGEVISERQLRRHRNRAGFRIGDDKHVDLFRYAAWLVLLRHTPRPEKSASDYEAHKEATRARNMELSALGRDIGEIPEVVEPDRKQKAAADFRFFCEAYFPQTFNLAWSPDHLKVMSKIEQAVLHGGLFALAMPRAAGKTSLAECACLWAVLYGHRDFVCLIGSDEGHALDMLDSLKMELDGNEFLLEDFPEAAYPIQCLDGIAHRANGQLYQGRRTQIGWTAREIILPTIPGSRASGAIIKVAGITGRIRGMKFKRPDGKTVRPSLVVLDDPQTDESARSPSQCAQRESILAGAVLGLAGPGKKISGIMPCTVIRPGDMAERILDREKHPAWQGERTKMVYSFPSNQKLWDKYAQILADGLRNDQGIKAATEFYRQNREAMDEGTEVAWQQRYNPDELSAIQHAMNLKLQDEAAFFAEYQNEPLAQEQENADILTAEQVATKLNGRPRGQVPQDATCLTGFVDIQDKVLFWCVCAWQEDFTGYVIDYGTLPDQRRAYFTVRDATRGLDSMFPGAGKEGAVQSGLEKLASDLLGRQWKKINGSLLQISRLLIDSGYLPVVANAVRVKVGQTVMLSKGMGIKAGRKPMASYRRKPGEKHGWNWYIPNPKRSNEFAHVAYDTNFWKSFTHTRLATAAGDHGAMTLFGKNPEQHRLFAEHIAEAESFVVTEGHGRTVQEWQIKPPKPDNHWFDCLVGCTVAASMQGVALPGMDFRAAAKRQRIKLSDLQRSR